MRKLIIIPALAAALGVCVMLGSAESFAIGDVRLTGSAITIEKQLIKATGSPKLVMPDASLTAKVIEVTLVKGKTGKLTFGKASATGGVTIHAKQTDKQTKTSRDVDASAETATLVAGEDKVVLEGSARVKITDPELEEPALLTGRVITVYLKSQKIEALGEPTKQAELNLKPKPKPKK